MFIPTKTIYTWKGGSQGIQIGQVWLPSDAWGKRSKLWQNGNFDRARGGDRSWSRLWVQARQMLILFFCRVERNSGRRAYPNKTWNFGRRQFGSELRPKIRTSESAQNRSRFGADSAPNDVRPMFAGFGRPIGSDFTQKVVRQMFVRIGHDSVVLRGANSVFRTYPESDPIRSSDYM